MTKQPKKLQSLNLYIYFHFPKEASYPEEVKHIETLMASTFGDAQGVVYKDEAHGELIHSVQRPRAQDFEDCESFFKALGEVFTATEHLTPHFTQFTEEEA